MRLRSLLLVLILVGDAPASPRDRRLSDDDLAPVAGAFRGYSDARASAVGVESARSSLFRAVRALEGALGGADPLRHAADLGRAVWLSRDYADGRVRRGKVTSEELARGSFTGGGLTVAYRLPKTYDTERSTYPLILSIPDEGEEPADHLRARWTDRAILEGAVIVSPVMPANREDWTRVMVRGRPGGLSHILTALRMGTERFAVDFDRIYVAGTGKGVPAAVAAGNYSPQRFAGIIGRGGDVGEATPENFGNLPTYFAGGGAQATAFQRAVQKAGYDNCVLDAAGGEREVWSWMRDNTRNAYPASVTVVPGDPFPTRAYWLRIAPTAPDARATATFDRESGSVEIGGHGFSRAILYLSDALLDLDRPIRVTAGGTEHEVVVARDVAATVDMLYDGTSDPGSVYVAELVYDVASSAIAYKNLGAAIDDGDYDDGLRAAGTDPSKLWAFYEWCESTGRQARGAGVLRKVLRADPDHEQARAALGHVRSGELWFPSEEALARFEAGQVEEVARSKGHVKFKSVWMHRDERALMKKGFSKDSATGVWLSADDRKRLAAGWSRQDLAWIAPADVHRADDGLWRVGGEWLSLADANRRRAKIDSMWRIPGPDVLLHSTADRDVSLRAMGVMGDALADLRHVFGAEPSLPLPVALLRDEEQYDRFAFGDPDGHRPATHAGRLHVIHSAFFAESWFPVVEGKREFDGMGVCYWDALAPYGNQFGVHAARLAVGLSYVEALDPSPKAVRRATADGPGPGFYGEYLGEKRLPAWLRYGGAVYAERFFHDPTVGSDGDPWWARKWSLDNLKSRGGLRSLDEVFAFRLDPDDRDDGQKLLIEAGLVVAFIVDGACPPVVEAHEALKRALVSGRLHANQLEALSAAVAANGDALARFAGG